MREGGGSSIVVVVALKKHQLYPLFVAFSDVFYGLAWPFQQTKLCKREKKGHGISAYSDTRGREGVLE